MIESKLSSTRNINLKKKNKKGINMFKFLLGIIQVKNIHIKCKNIQVKI